jgi:hypothetical protein
MTKRLDAAREHNRLRPSEKLAFIEVYFHACLKACNWFLC